MVAHSRIISGEQTACVFGKVKIGVHIEKIYPCFAASAAAARALGYCRSLGGVDSRTLRTADELDSSLVIAAFDREYFAGAFGTAMSHNVHPVPRLCKIKGCAVKHHPFNTIPQFRKRTEDGLKRPEAVMRYESGNIFKQKSCRSLFFNNSGKFKEKSSAGIGKPSSESAARKALAWEPADEQVKVGHSCCVNSCNVAIINLSLRVINGFVSRRSVLVDLAVPDTFKAARLFKTAAETSDSGKAVEKFNCYIITPLQNFASILTLTFSVHCPELPSAP